MPPEVEYASRILAEVCVRRAFEGGRSGVFAESVPRIDPEAFLAEVEKLSEDAVRVALLGGSGVPKWASRLVELTTDPTTANVWRNDTSARGGRRLITVVLGPAPRLNSLRSALLIVKAEHIRATIAARCLRLVDSPARAAFLQAVEAASDDIPTPRLIAYAARLEELAAHGKAALLDGEPAEVRRLGLLPSAAQFNNPAAALARRAIRRNLDLLRSLRPLQPRVRQSLAELVESEHELAGRASALLAYENAGEFGLLGNLTFEEVEETLKTRAQPLEKGTPPPPPKSSRARTDGDALAVDLLIDEGGHGMQAAAKRFQEAIEPDGEGVIDAEEVRVGRRTIRPRIRLGTTQATTMFGRYLTEDVWGALVSTDQEVDFVGAQKLVASGDAEVEEFRPGDTNSVRDILQRAADRGFVSADALERWDAYAVARAKLLPHANALIDHPLLALVGSADLLANARELLGTYTAALAAIVETSRALEERNATDAARRLTGTALALDVAFIATPAEFVSIAAPTHPFHVWRWLSLVALFEEHRDELRELGKDTLQPLVTDPPSACPQVVLSPFALRARRLDRSRPFIPTGSFAALPLFGEPTARQLGKFRARSLAKIAQRLLRLMPHAGLGLHVALIDPPSVVGALEDLLELDNPLAPGETVVLHVTVARTRAARETTDEEDDAVSTLARDLADQGGTLVVLSEGANLREVAAKLKVCPPHIAVVFDPGTGERIAVPVAQRPSLSPLITPRAYRYDEFDDRLDMVVAGDAEPFATYHDLYCRTLDVPRTDFIGRRSGASQNARALQEIAEACVWMVVIDQALEPTLRIGSTLRLDWRSDGGRDVVTFTAHPETVDDLIGDAIRLVGLVPDEQTRRRTINDLFHLSGDAVLGLARGRAGATAAEPRVARETIGVLAAQRWYQGLYPEALLISLDDATSRAWILGCNDDNRRSDLLGLRPSEGGVVVEALEVKAHDDPHAGVVEREPLSGHAVDQVDQTITTLRKVMTLPANSPVMRARQDMLRDQLYRAVASRPYSADRRGRLVRLLEEFFHNGPREVAGFVVRVAIEPGAGRAEAVVPRWFQSSGGNRVGLVDVIESGAAVSTVVVDVRQPPSLPAGLVAEGGQEPPSTRTPSRAPAGVRAGDGVPFRVLIGKAPGGSEVTWEPHRRDAHLNNFGVLVTGDPGSGKTQMLKVLISEGAARGLPLCIFDYKADYSDEAFAQQNHLQVFDIDRKGLPFNPLSLVPDARGEAQPIRQIHELVGILGRIFDLGDQQQARLRRAIVDAYGQHNIASNERLVVAQTPSPPGFNEVRRILDADPHNEALLNRLSPLFDLRLFPDAEEASTSFERLIGERVVLKLSSLPNDRIKAAISEFVIVRLHGHVVKGDQPRELRRMLVFDEAWRVNGSVRLQELAREGRAFGLGLIVATQFPGDLPENLAGNLATQLLLSNQDPDHRRAVVRTLCGAGSGPDAQRLLTTLSHLQKYEGFFRNQQYAPWCLVRTIPYYERV